MCHQYYMHSDICCIMLPIKGLKACVFYGFEEGPVFLCETFLLINPFTTHYCLGIWTCWRHHYACSDGNNFLQDFPVILKHLFQKIVLECESWEMTVWIYSSKSHVSKGLLASTKNHTKSSCRPSEEKTLIRRLEIRSSIWKEFLLLCISSVEKKSNDNENSLVRRLHEKKL